MKNWLQIDLFSWNKIDKGWWAIYFLKLEGKTWSWHLLFIEENLDNYQVEWFSFRLEK